MKKLFAFIVILSVALSAKAAEKKKYVGFDRGLGLRNMTATCFIPKGTLGAGITASYTNYNVGNMADDAGYKLLLGLIDGTKGGLRTFGVSPHAEFFFMDNLSAGIRFDYDRTGFNIDSANISLGDLITFGINDRTYLKQMYSGALTLRDYMPIGNSRRFAFFAELNVGGASGQSKSFLTKLDDDNNPYKTGTFQKIYKASVGLIPGIMCFFTNEVALEVSVGVLGFSWQKIVQNTDQLAGSSMTSSNASFKINLLSIKIGMSFYVPVVTTFKKK